MSAREIEFASIDEAHAAREEFEDHLAEIDDWRKKSVAVVEDAGETVREMEFRAADGLADVETGYNPADMELTASERSSLDFSETPYVEAAAAKAALTKAGVSDFESHYDPTLSVDENRERVQSARKQQIRHGGIGSQGDRRLDEQPSGINQMAQQYRAAERGREQHAIKGVRQGSAEARQELRGMGWSPAEIEEIVATGQVRAALTPGATVQLTNGHRTTPRKWATAKRSHEHRPVASQRVDEARQAPVTTDVEKWRRNPHRFDYPGVDTRRPIDEYLDDEDREEFRSLTRRLWTWQPGTGRGL